MSDVAPLEQPTTQAAPATQQGQTDMNQLMAENLWNLNPTAYTPVEAAPVTTEPAPPAQQPPAANEPAPAPQANEATPAVSTPAPADDILGVDDYFNKEFGMNAQDFRAKWEELNKPSQPQEVKWSYDDSREEEIYNFIHQKRTLDRLEKMEVTDANQAAEIIRANLQFKYKDLQPAEIDRLFARQYAMPQKPVQALDQSDDDYAASLQVWEAQVKERQQDMIIDAKLARPELAKLKNEIVQPDIPKIQVNQPNQPSQEELAKREAGRKNYLSAVESSYQGFKGYSVTAKDGDVQLPINYSISPEELSASKQLIEDFNMHEFFDKRWFDEKNNPRVNQIQDDLYLILNRDKIFQAIANESATKMHEHHLKIQNNINLSGVNKNLGPTPPAPAGTKTPSQAMADSIWAL